MKDVVLEISGLGNSGNRYERQMRVYEKRARKARAEAYALVFGFLGRGVVSVIRGIARGIRRWHTENATVRELSALDDRLLKDIGLERSKIRALASTLSNSDARTYKRPIEQSHHARAETKVESTAQDADQQSTEQEWQRAA